MAKTKTKTRTKNETTAAKRTGSRKAAPVASPAAGSVAPGVDIGIADRDRKTISQDLAQFLSDSFTLYLKTHNFHWNVTGPMFNSLHAMFMDQYTEQWNALDDIAERIRALGYNAPGSYAEFIKLSTIAEEPGLTEAPDWRAMVGQLVDGNEAVCRTARRALSHADDAGDDPTVDLLTQRLQIHEKNAWMLRSLLQ
ncbi:Dps family protein [Luteimonas terricola]|uniref:DNA starvation/stationary phase protection protein n=1 Tax=Luteimonas terricola TaxID=645597 RepID=A0ABQ2E7T3_9GAMM|nr:Dps family protein [Luteimonas terricola]GGK00002.1 DNA starvation/stationary phase protection protein [Luteimonas terricola]